MLISVLLIFNKNILKNKNKNKILKQQTKHNNYLYVLITSWVFLSLKTSECMFDINYEY